MVGPATVIDSRPIADAVAACRRHLLAVAGFSAMLNLLYIGPTLYMLQVYSRVVPTHSRATLLFLTLAMLLALATLATLDGLRGRLLVRAGVRLDRQLAPLILSAALEPGAGPSARQVIREFDALRQVLSGPAVLAMVDAPWTPIYVLVCFVLHPFIGLAALAGIIVLPLLARLNDRTTGGAMAESQARATMAYVAQDEMLGAADMVRGLGMRSAAIKRVLAMRELAAETMVAAQMRASGYTSLSRFVRLSLQSLALGLGALLAIRNLISGGAIFAASFLIGRALMPIEQVIASWKTIEQARIGYANLKALLDHAETAEQRTALPAPQGALAVEGASVTPGPGAAPILDDVSFAVSAGQVVAVVGPSGAGKSTLLRVIAGALPGYSGTVRFDGADRRDWAMDALGAAIGYLPQSASLLSGTIKENISRFAGAVDPAIDAGVIRAAQLAGVHEMILRLERGYDHPVAFGGGNLSSGQAQRIALARALYGNPAVVLLDEPNAHLDSEGEQKLAETVRLLKQQGTTVLLVSHRPAILDVVDTMLVLIDGKVAQFGPRDTVMARISRPRAVNAAA